MHVDLYSLGRGEICSGSFGLRNLQVLTDYRLESIPEEVVSAACGPFGEWKQGDPSPKLEIVGRRQQPRAYMRLAPEFRTADFQKSGTVRKLVPMKGLERKMFPESSKPLTVSTMPYVKKASTWEIPDKKEEAAKAVEEMRDEVVEEPLPEIPAPLGERPNIDMAIGPEHMNLDTSIFDDDIAAASDPLPGLGFVEPKETDVDAAPRCTGTNKNGQKCHRRPAKDSERCGAHPL